MAMLDPAVSALLALCGAVLFASAAAHKIRSLAQFAAVIAAYRILPARLVPLATRTLPLLELLCAAGMLIDSSRSWAAAFGAVLLLTYGIAIAVNLSRGRSHIDCGCAGFGRRRPLAGWMIGRNGTIAALLLALLPSSHTRALAWTDALTVLGGAIVVISLYVAADSLLGRTADSLWKQSAARNTEALQ